MVERYPIEVALLFSTGVLLLIFGYIAESYGIKPALVSTAIGGVVLASVFMVFT
jgi:hypothetical protein